MTADQLLAARKPRQFEVIREVLDRDGHRCQPNLDGVCTTLATTVHHVKSKAHGDDPRFLVAACQPCNLKVGNPTRHDPDPIPWSCW